MNEPLDKGSSFYLDIRSKCRSRGIGNSMTPKVILERLQIMSDLSRACQELGQAKRIGKVKDISDGSVTSNRVDRSETT